MFILCPDRSGLHPVERAPRISHRSLRPGVGRHRVRLSIDRHFRLMPVSPRVTSRSVV
jgi:hypothetical protein